MFAIPTTVRSHFPRSQLFDDGDAPHWGHVGARSLGRIIWAINPHCKTSTTPGASYTHMGANPTANKA